MEEKFADSSKYENIVLVAGVYNSSCNATDRHQRWSRSLLKVAYARNHLIVSDRIIQRRQQRSGRQRQWTGTCLERRGGKDTCMCPTYSNPAATVAAPTQGQRHKLWERWDEEGRIFWSGGI
jgi:hypothetical protein